jgi:hypothetical protein
VAITRGLPSCPSVSIRVFESEPGFISAIDQAVRPSAIRKIDRYCSGTPRSVSAAPPEIAIRRRISEPGGRLSWDAEVSIASPDAVKVGRIAEDSRVS